MTWQVRLSVWTQLKAWNMQWLWHFHEDTFVPTLQPGWSLSHSDGSANCKKVDGSTREHLGGHEVTGAYTWTGVVTADTQEVIRINPKGQDTTNTINRAELVGV